MEGPKSAYASISALPPLCPLWAEDKLELFFCKLYEFHNTVPNVVPAFVPAVSNVVPFAPPVIVLSPVISSDVSTVYSVVSSANFIPVSSPSCIGTNR